MRPLEKMFYPVEVTSADLWQQVGRLLAHARVDRHWGVMDVEHAGGPSYKTVQAIERGDVGTVESLDKCAQALDLTLVDLLYSVLAARVTPLSPEAAQIVRKFTATTVAGRQAMLTVAAALPLAAETTAGPSRPDAAAAPAPVDPLPPAPAATARHRPRAATPISPRVPPAPPSQTPLSRSRKRQPTPDKKRPQ